MYGLLMRRIYIYIYCWMGWRETLLEIVQQPVSCIPEHSEVDAWNLDRLIFRVSIMQNLDNKCPMNSFVRMDNLLTPDYPIVSMRIRLLVSGSIIEEINYILHCIHHEVCTPAITTICLWDTKINSRDYWSDLMVHTKINGRDFWSDRMVHTM